MGDVPRLPRGATGFWGVDDPELPSTCLKDFTRVCYQVARQLDGRVEDVRRAEYPANHHVAVIGVRGRVLALLCHRHLPLLALAEPGVEGSWEITFLDEPVLAEALAGAFASVGLRVLSFGLLQADVTRADLSELAPAELDQVRYWGPRTVGALLFNFWD